MNEITVKKITLMNDEIYTYREIGHGENIFVLVHGNISSSLFFEDLMHKLSSTYKVIALDLRGFGDSSYHRPIDSLRDFAGDIKLFVDALGLTSFELLGWSTGGSICMSFTAMYGRYVKHLFLMSSVGISGYQSYRVESDGTKIPVITKDDMRKDVPKMTLANILSSKDMKSIKKVWRTSIYNKSIPSEATYHKQMLESMKQKNIFDVYYALSNFNISHAFNGVNPGSEEIDNIHCPTILIHGEDDLIITVKEAMHTKESIGENARLVLLKDCGHSPMIDAFDDLVRIIYKYA